MTAARTADAGVDAWKARARCLGLPPAEFFPPDGLGVEHAQLICADCPVHAECLDYALANEINNGVWGGASERQRRRILHHRNRLHPTTTG